MAYQRAQSRAEEAAALALLGEISAKQEEWRPALNAYRASLQLADNPAIRRTYEALRAEHGFRILDYKVDSDSASPRVCFQFSEELDRGKLDFTPFVAVSGAANAAVTAEGQQLCVDGLRHGERYAVVVRQGLPSAVGETLLKSADYEVYVRDRSPQVRFTGRNYVLPRTGQEGIPVVSVNTAKVDVEVFRIGDRSLLPTIRSEDFLSQLARYSAEAIGSEKGFKVWTGTLDTRSELNRDVVTAFPVLEAVGKLEPGVYVMTAKPTPARRRTTATTRPRATQWFVVSDLGLTAFTGEDGVHVFAALARQRRADGGRRDPPGRPQQRGAGHRGDGRDGPRRASTPGLARGEGGLAPGLVVATTARRRLRLPRPRPNAFDLTDRGVKGRPAPGAVDAYVFPERGVYRTGETVHLTALLRDAKGVAIPSLPLTLVVKRPDGVEHRRVSVADQGLGGRSLSLPILSGALRGTWRVEAFTDPKSPAVGEAALPGRGLRAGAAGGDAGAEGGGAAARASRPRSTSPPATSTARRAPPFDGHRRGHGPEGRRRAGSRASTASPSASTTRRSRRSTAEIEEPATTDAQGPRHGDRAGAGARRPAPDRGARSCCASARPAAGRSSAASPCRSCPSGPVIGVRKRLRRDSPRARPRPSTWCWRSPTARASRAPASPGTSIASSAATNGSTPTAAGASSR